MGPGAVRAQSLAGGGAELVAWKGRHPCCSWLPGLSCTPQPRPLTSCMWALLYFPGWGCKYGGKSYGTDLVLRCPPLPHRSPTELLGPCLPLIICVTRSHCMNPNSRISLQPAQQEMIPGISHFLHSWKRLGGWRLRSSPECSCHSTGRGRPGT